jgi:alginate O-acetyltransferase complex protein AlgI
MRPSQKQNKSSHINPFLRGFFSSKPVFFYSIIIIAVYELLIGLSLPAIVEEVLTFLIPLVSCFTLVWILRKNQFKKPISYFLFFTITFASYLGLTKTLTGFPVFSSNYFLLGLPFYTTFLAYRLFQNKLDIKDFLIAANPLLLITGPIAVRFISLRNTHFKRRFKIFSPYLVIGIFFFKILSIPMSQFLPMAEKTDIISIILFAFIFELFIYFNFAGLSLIIYAVFGIMGIHIPLNFKQPFSSRDLISYWKGWHLSLSVVLKKLFYIPFRRINLPIAVFVVFISSALWHGLSFNFIYWGLFQATTYILTIFLLRKGFLFWTPYLMILSILFGRFLFLENNAVRFLIKLNSFLTPNYVSPHLGNFSKSSILSLCLGMLVVGLEFIFRDKIFFKNRTYKFLRIPIVQTILIVIILFLISSSSGLNFAVYGQR